jgi:hypothetical protein
MLQLMDGEVEYDLGTIEFQRAGDIPTGVFDAGGVAIAIRCEPAHVSPFDPPSTYYRDQYFASIGGADVGEVVRLELRDGRAYAIVVPTGETRKE